MAGSASPDASADWTRRPRLDRLEVEHDNLRAALEQTAKAADPNELLAFVVVLAGASGGRAGTGLRRACGWSGRWPKMPTSRRAHGRALRAQGLIAEATGDRAAGPDPGGREPTALPA